MKMSSNVARFDRTGLLSPAEHLSLGTCTQRGLAEVHTVASGRFLPMLEMTVKHRLMPVLVQNIPPPCGILG